MRMLQNAVLRLEEVQELLRAVETGRCPAVMTGLSPVHRAHVAAAVAQRLERPVCVIVSDEREARRMAEDLKTFLGQEPLVLLPRELHFRSGAASKSWEQQRMAALYRLATEEGLSVVATVEGLTGRTIPKEVLLETALELHMGGRYEPSALAERLVRAGYVRTAQVEGPGQFALRGGILDVFSPLMERPVRCEFFDDEVDSMGVFDTLTQRRVENVEHALLLAAGEVLPDFAPGGRQGLGGTLQKLAEKYEKKAHGALTARTLRGDAELLLAGGALPAPDRYAAAVYPEMTTGFSYLPCDALVVLSDSARVLEREKGALLEWKEDWEALLEDGLLAGEYSRLMLESGEFAAALEDWPVCCLDALPTSRYIAPPKTLLALMAKQLASYGGSLDTAAADMEQYLRGGFAVQVLCTGEGRARNLQTLLQERGISAALDLRGTALPAPGEARISVGALSAGMEYPALHLAVLTEGQLLAQGGRRKRREKKEDSRHRLQSFTDLSPGDLVVHAHHGVGRFVGVQRMPVEGVEKDYIKIAYAGSDCLYVPATSLDLVSKYIGGGEEPEKTKLNRLGGTDWQKTTRKAKAAAKDLARGLIALYAERQRRPGYAFSPDSPWQQEFEEAFEYEETDDQLRCIEEVKRDMERPAPMDRLLCGDVGYGKTEVALRAVMKCVLDGKQAAILVPTTVLAQQHYTTAIHRFRGYPVNIAVLSRFQSARQSAKILKDLEAGRIDLLIGTHRLLQKSVKFRDLGLLIIDEEQRFGVTHKEKLKEMSRQVDVLTLSATPIPRTLNMALSGIRDMSTLEEPPRERQPVQTYVLEHEWPVLMDAMRRELARGGQVFYLHNRVESIDAAASRIQTMLGEEARVLVAHGKLGEQELSSVMQKMVEGDADVLVCTTIIETGIDMPNVNTLIIEDADRLGLAQLHQIRGRIGRSSRRAYAYMTYRPAKILTEVAAKRLGAIREFVEFGSGFKIAMRDLEIRGAGNLLGPEQSGYMMSVGYDMYLQLLEEAVLEEKGEAPKKKLECSADLTVSANIPERYVSSPEQRMDLYRRIAAIRGTADADDVLDELTDRYGEPPRSVLALLDVALLRAAAAEAGVADITQKGERVLLRLGELDVPGLAAVCGMQKYRGRLSLLAGDDPALSLKLRKGEDVLESALELVEDLKLTRSGAAD